MTANGTMQVVSGEYVRGGKSTTYEYCQQSVGSFPKWCYRKQGEEKWMTCTSLWEKRALKAWHDSSILRLFDESPRLKEMEERIQELQAKVNPTAASGEMPFGDDITPETIIEPVMYREDILGPRPKYRTLQRHHVGDARYYVQQFEQPDGSFSRPELYPGVTSVCKAILPRSRHIEEWLCSFPTYAAAMLELNKLAARGTVMHTLFAQCMDGTLPAEFNSSEFDRNLRHLISRNLEGLGVSVDEVFNQWKTFMCKAILGFKQFIYDYNVEVLAIEIVLGTPTIRYEDKSKPTYGYFLQADLICNLDWEFPGYHGEVYKSGPRKGQPKITKQTRRVLGIGDFKSGDGDYSDHTLQLELTLPVVKKTFPHLDFKDAVIFNWHPTDYRVSSLAEKAAKSAKEEENGDEDGEAGKSSDIEFGYKVLDKTNKMPRGWAKDHLRLWQKYHAGELPMKMVFQGDPNIGTPPKDNVRFVDYQTYWAEKISRAVAHKFADL